jgi:two-component system, NarL family, capsular synthesis sensor histidine kinase RcsC
MQFSLIDSRSRIIGTRFGYVTRWLVPFIYFAVVCAFAADLSRANTLAYGIAYVPLIGTALLHRHRWTLWGLTGLSIAMIAIGAFLPALDPDLFSLVSNRLLSIIAILVTAVLVYHARDIQDRLAAATRRAETAERIRTDVLSNLGREMRTPLHSMMAILGLLLANCRTDQREALAKMRAGGRQLLLTLDNLIDLTEIDGQSLQPVPTDVAAILRKSLGAAEPVAQDSRVLVETGHHPSDDAERFEALVDPSATRRILDNLLFNAIRVTEPGGIVTVGIRQDDTAVVVAVGDMGDGVPESLATQAPSDIGAMAESLLTPSIGVGLTLGRRLAQVMAGSVVVETLPGAGSVVTLRLPLATRGSQLSGRASTA